MLLGYHGICKIKGKKSFFSESAAVENSTYSYANIYVHTKKNRVTIHNITPPPRRVLYLFLYLLSVARRDNKIK